ncbi:unnamed protein product [Microthlaspi erraticum]|uniref:Uncharacterized protein n=1 Tax=Microthlaspi erraticum TaxID=1685480 RepID=A0A6D2JZQ0_9BRAS|nr:unnamed protein product [Microthlaspi erraticum]
MDSMSEAFDQMQMVKDVLANSDKVSEVLQESTHQFNLLTSPTFLPKVKDQGKFTLPCTLGHLEIDNALVDSGASINLISLSMAEKLGIAGALQRPTTSIMFGDATSKSPLGVFKNYHLKIGECIIQTDLTVMEMEEEKDLPCYWEPLSLPRGSDFCATIDSTNLSSKSHGATKVVKERVDKEPRVGKDKDERGPRIEKPRLERARVEKPRSDRPRAERLVQAPCVLDEESLQALFDEPLGRALKEGEDAASKARPGDKRKDPPAQAPSVKPSQLTMTLFPTKFENGKIEYKIRYKGRSRPFSRAKALVTSEQSRDPTKLKELLSQVLTITLDVYCSSIPSFNKVFWSILEHMGHKEHGGTWHMEAAQLDTQRKKGEAILKTSSTVHSTNRSSSSTRPAKLQLDRAGESKSNPKNVASPLTFL